MSNKVSSGIPLSIRCRDKKPYFVVLVHWFIRVLWTKSFEGIHTQTTVWHPICNSLQRITGNYINIIPNELNYLFVGSRRAGRTCSCSVHVYTFCGYPLLFCLGFIRDFSLQSLKTPHFYLYNPLLKLWHICERISKNFYFLLIKSHTLFCEVLRVSLFGISCILVVF